MRFSNIVAIGGSTLKFTKCMGPDYFENREPPIICYKYNKPIRSTIFNFNKLVANLDIDTKTPDS